MNKIYKITNSHGYTYVVNDAYLLQIEKLFKMKQTHTKGKWIYEEKKTQVGRCFCIGTKEMLNYKKGDTPKIPSYACIYDDYGTGNNETEANAKLIVTAVNNFEGLKAIAKTVKFWFSNEANYPEGTAGYNLAKEAEEILKQIEKEL